ncbi:hypothetical protein KCTC52924_03817 [Arenibacter antarcticus]|uniref:DUF6340 family protein n=1 Tax=Arenibacter antarcticus TaxID=2040469 RepID=A0ABW5VDQ1_9FLAO|nr:DUF6340 family protein [Arenibacter sp. H213]MCM4168255.1 hypothetical protein [Arenibacter sp. H213]
MKNSRSILCCIGVFTLLISCSATNNLTMGTTQPAVVSIPKEVATIGIINRSAPSENNQSLDKIDKILSAEGLHLDEKGGEAAVLALSDALIRTDLFTEVKVLEGTPEIRKGLNILPTTLPWDIVEKLCEENGVDLIFSLEFYDTDTKVSYSVGTYEFPNQLGLKVSLPGHQVTLNTQINNGWRIYDPKNRVVLDQFIYSDGFIASGKGINPMKAVEAIARRNETVMDYSKNMGNAYGLRLSPLRHRVNRDYFVRGTDNFEVAKRRAQTGDWMGAAQLWEREVGNPKSKIAGRACYNMAIINEINGDLETAMDWASRSYTDHKNKDALRYLKILEYRAEQNRVLQEQASR